MPTIDSDCKEGRLRLVGDYWWETEIASAINVSRPIPSSIDMQDDEQDPSRLVSRDGFK